MKERQWIDNLRMHFIDEQQMLARYDGFKYFCRFVDDRFTPNYEDDLPGKDDYGIDIRETGRGPSLPFIGIQFTATETNLTFKARDKQHAFDFKIIRYPSWHSAVPSSVRRATVIGMLVRTIRLTRDWEPFIDEAKFILSTFHDRGYPLVEMRQATNIFVAKHVNHQRAQSGRKRLGEHLTSIFDTQVPQQQPKRTISLRRKAQTVVIQVPEQSPLATAADFDMDLDWDFYIPSPPPPPSPSATQRRQPAVAQQAVPQQTQTSSNDNAATSTQTDLRTTTIDQATTQTESQTSSSQSNLPTHLKRDMVASKAKKASSKSTAHRQNQFSVGSCPSTVNKHRAGCCRAACGITPKCHS